MTLAGRNIGYAMDPGARLALRDGLRRTSVVAGMFVLLVISILAGTVIRDHVHGDLIAETRIEQLKAQLASDSSNTFAKEQIRAEDERLRAGHFARRAFVLHGAWLLLGGAVIFVICGKLAAQVAATPYLPGGPVPVELGWGRKFAVSIGSGSAVLLIVLVILRLPPLYGTRFAIPTARQAPPVPQNVVEAPAVAPAWPGFRGPSGLGIATGEYPSEWDASSGKNIVWKTAVPLPGFGSPVVAGAHVFLAGGNDQRREVYCFNAGTGTLEWTRPVGNAGPAGLNLSQDTGWAPSTPATDGQRVFAIFPTGDLACFDLAGRPVWKASLGLPQNTYGHTSSLLAWGGMLFVQFDQGTAAKASRSALYAYACDTGKVRWRAGRSMPASWSTPVVIPMPSGPQLITLGAPWIVAYEPGTGAEIWRAKGLAGEVVPSPAFSGGIVYAATEQSSLLAIKADGHGDVTATHLRAVDAEGLPDIVSPIAVGGRVLLGSSNGTLNLVDPTAGKSVWTQDLQESIHSSPVAVGSRVYLADLKGTTHVFEAADSFKEIARCELGQEVSATPAFANGKIYIRGKTDLFCIGASGKEAVR